MFGPLDYGSGELATAQEQTANAAMFVVFLHHPFVHWPTGQLVLVLDNASYHRTAAVHSWFATHQNRISVIWLPTFPQLNLIERVWRFLKTMLACHRFWNDRDSLAKRAQSLCDAIRATFHAEASPHI